MVTKGNTENEAIVLSEYPTKTEADVSVPEKPIPKYSMVPRFAGRMIEIGAIDYVASFDPTGRNHLNFIDDDGRLWKGLLDDFVIIKNFPVQEDIEDFRRLKKEADEMYEHMRKKDREKESEKDRKDNAYF